MAVRRFTDPHYMFHMRRQHEDRRWVLATLRKRWFDMAGPETRSKDIAEVWVDCSGMTEGEAVAACLADLRLALLDELESSP